MNPMQQRNHRNMSGPAHLRRQRLISQHILCNNGSASLQHLDRPRKRYRVDNENPFQIHHVQSRSDGSFVDFSVIPITEKPPRSNSSNRSNLTVRSNHTNQSITFDASSNPWSFIKTSDITNPSHPDSVSEQWNLRDIPQIPTRSVSPPDIAPNGLFYVSCPMPMPMSLPMPLPPVVSPSPTVSTVPPQQHQHELVNMNTSSMTPIHDEHPMTVTNPNSSHTARAAVDTVHTLNAVNTASTVSTVSPVPVAVPTTNLNAQSNHQQSSYRPRQPEAIIPALCPKR